MKQGLSSQEWKELDELLIKSNDLQVTHIAKRLNERLETPNKIIVR